MTDLDHDGAASDAVEPISPAAAIGRAASYFQRGELARAGRLCSAILEVDETSFDALLLLGLIEHRQRHFEPALGLVERAIRQRPDSPEALAQHGVVLAALGRHDEALASYDAALSHRPGFVAALYNRANALQALGRHEESLAAFDRVLATNHDDAGALNNRGVVLDRLGRHQEALDSYARSLAARPDSAETWNNRGNALQALGFHDEALASYAQALDLAREYPEALNNRGNALQALGRLGEALEGYGRAIEARPAYAEALNNRAAVLLELGRVEEALADCERALALHPDYAEALSNRGSALEALDRAEEALLSHERSFALRPGAVSALNLGTVQQALGRHEAALISYDMALTINPEYAEAWNNRGNALQALNRHEAAVHHFQKAAALKPEDAEAHWNEGLARLTLGDYRGGWEKYEWRWRNAKIDAPRPFGEQPVWLGREEIAGKTVLLYAEQGFGDAIQFIRYAPLVAGRGARVLVACHESLRSLFATVEGVRQTLTHAREAPAFDLQAPLMSLPLAFRTTLRSIPREIPYLRAEPGRVSSWRGRLAGAPGRLRVGLAWSGNPRLATARVKACPVGQLAPLLEQRDIAFFSLQKGAAAEELDALRGPGREVADYTGELHDFADTAALVAALDLVISVDTAVAHLAGALGTPVWILLPYSADWRWLVAREDSPWYPGARLFRHARPGDWKELIERVGKALAAAAQAQG